ncbi:hypothetical protein QE450_003544 [Paenibacillus sp. SORGH_AS306]|nr:hypothetical protein [Paenibacillus sp. SORGH_AS_0306]MDR6108402.1 hypothetical protein [Paenibacillus sp. SORGH_AS_0338]
MKKSMILLTLFLGLINIASPLSDVRMPIQVLEHGIGIKK